MRPLLFQGPVNKLVLALNIILFISALALVGPRAVNAQGMPPTNPVVERISTGALTLDAAENDLALQEIRRDLESLDRVRVEVAVAPGHGHQSASIRLIQRLRELGFKGITEVIYREHSARQLTTLIPGFDSWKSEQSLTSKTLGYLELIAHGDFIKDKNRPVRELGFSAASDTPSSIYDYRALKVKNLIHLQPRNWVRRSSDRRVWIEGATEWTPRQFDLSHLYRLGTTTTPPETANIEPLLESLQNGKNFFRAFFQAAPTVDVMPAYSIDFTEKPEKVMEMVLDGLKHAMELTPERFTKPVVVPIFTVFRDPNAREAFDASLRAKGVQVLQATGNAVVSRISELAPREVLAVHIGATPPALFEAMVSRATLPVVLEGKNLTQMSLDHGLPFLNVIGNQKDFDQEMYDRKIGDRAVGLVHGAFNAFDDRVSRFGAADKRAIGRYISELQDPNSELRRFFAEQKADPGSVNRDLLAQALLELRAAKRYSQQVPVPRSTMGYPGNSSGESLPRGVKRCHVMHGLNF